MQKLRAQEKALKRSSIIAELVDENSEAPQEISEYSGAKKRVIKERSHRTKYEIVPINLYTVGSQKL